MPASTARVEVDVRKTGGQIDDLVQALIAAAHDSDDAVHSSISSSIQGLGKRQPELVLSSCLNFLFKHTKLATTHRITLLNCMEEVIRELPGPLDDELASALVHQASREMTQSKEIVPAWQNAASGVLVAMGNRHVNCVMEELMVKFQPGVLPHFFTVETMAKMAVSNVFGMVPFLKGTLGTMLPMMGMAKQDNMKWVFSYALAKFSEAIIDYVANIENAPDSSVKKSFFSAEIYVAHDVLLNVWLQTRETKLRLQVVEALGFMSHIMSRDKLAEQMPKLLPAMLNLYKKQGDAYHITQGLWMILDAATEGGSTLLENLLDNLLNILFPQMCAPVDYSNHMNVKNHNELLRCFEVLARSFSSREVGFLLPKLEVNNEKIKMAALSVLRHLINTASTDMEDKKGLVLSGLRVCLSETNNKVKKVFAQTVIAMAHHGYLELEGGQDMIEFIVRQCALTTDPMAKRPPDLDYVSNEALRSMCDNVLQLLSTTVENMQHVLYPYLLECIVPEQYSEAQATVCRCVGHLAKDMQQNYPNSFLIDFEKEVNVPKPPMLFARLMVLSGWPLHGHNRGVHSLTALLSLAPLVHDSLASLWDSVIPKLIQHLEEALDNEKEPLSQKNWEDLTLKLLSKSLDHVDNEEWTCCLGDAFSSQLPLYANLPEEKNFACKCLGVVLRKSSKKDFVLSSLLTLFSSVKHTVELEREGCAIALGFAAASHLDIVLQKLESWMKNKGNGGKSKSSGIFSFIKDSIGQSSELEEKMKATLILSYGYAALYCPVSLVVSRMEAQILRAVQQKGTNIKDPDVKLSFLRSVELIGRAMHPSHLKISHTFSERPKLLEQMLGYITNESPHHLDSETRALAMWACATLVKLEPALSEDEVMNLMQSALNGVMLLPEGGRARAGSRSSKEENYGSFLEQELLLEKTLLALEELHTEVLLTDTTPSRLETLLVLLTPWSASLEDVERTRAMALIHQVLGLFHEKVDVVASSSNFSNLGMCLARLVPRCADPLSAIRQAAISSMLILLRTALKFECGDPGKKDPMLDALPTLQERLSKGEPSILFSVVTDVAKVLSKKVPPDQLLSFLEVLFEGLMDPQSHSASAVCIVLNSVIKSRGGELHSQVGFILSCLHSKLQVISHPQTRTGILRVVRTLASHHMLSVVEFLTSRSLPLDGSILECWRSIGQDAQLTASIVDHVLEQLKRCLPYEEKPNPAVKDETMRVATALPLSMTLALTELVRAEESLSPVLANYARLLTAMMVQVASCVGTKPPSQEEKGTGKSGKDKKSSSSKHRSEPVDPCSIAVAGLKTVCWSCSCTAFGEALDESGLWDLLYSEETYPKAFMHLARCLLETQPQRVGEVISLLNPVLTSMYHPQRVMAAAFFSELICHRCGGELEQVEMLVHSMLGRLVDSHHRVRMYCIRGLGNVAAAGSDQVEKYSTTVLSAMMTGMDDKDDITDDITLEAMEGLSKILSQINEAQIRAILINIALRIRPCFEKDRATVRSAAIRLFGELSRFGDGASKDAFLEQIHTNFVSLLLHLNDVDTDVKTACKSTLRHVGQLMSSENLNTMFQKHLIEGATLHYGEFMNDLSKVINQDFREKVNFYAMGCVTFFKSECADIRANAAMFLGFLVGNLSSERYSSVSREHICNSLVLLLKDHDKNVRVKTAEAISLLHDI